MRYNLFKNIGIKKLILNIVTLCLTSNMLLQNAFQMKSGCTALLPVVAPNFAQESRIDSCELTPLPLEEIYKSVRIEQGKASLVNRLFPSPYENADIMGINEKNLFHYLEDKAPEEKLGLFCELFRYCKQLRQSSEMLEKITSIENYTESISQNRIKLMRQLKKSKSDTVFLEKQLEALNYFSRIMDTYSTQDITWIFAMIARSIKSEREVFYTEQLLWSFCSEYFENNDLTLLSSEIKKATGIKLGVISDDSRFAYKMGVPINAQVSVTIEGVEFTDCIEVSILHFLYMTQPKNPIELAEYWAKSPLKKEILDFFKMQGSKMANYNNPILRTIWAKIVTKIPGLVYKKKTTGHTGKNNIELKAGWFNYLKTIAYLKNKEDIFKSLSLSNAEVRDGEALSDTTKEEICKVFCELAGNAVDTAEWIAHDKDEGIRTDMGDAGLDALGRLRVSFRGVQEPIDFVMQDGHGYVQWMTMDRKLVRNP